MYEGLYAWWWGPQSNVPASRYCGGRAPRVQRTVVLAARSRGSQFQTGIISRSRGKQRRRPLIEWVKGTKNFGTTYRLTGRSLLLFNEVPDLTPSKASRSHAIGSASPDRSDSSNP